MSGKESKSDAKVGGANTGKGSATVSGSGDGMMAAPGQKGEYISREAFESNPKGILY